MTGREGNQAAGGGAPPAPGPSRPPRPGGGGTGPQPDPPKKRGGTRRRCVRLASTSAPCGGGAGDLLPSPPHPLLPSPRGRPLGSGCKAPLPEPRAQPAPPAGRALQLQEIPEALHHPGAARSPGCQGSPKESHMPAGRAARPQLPPQPPPQAASNPARQPRRAGRGARPAAPSRAPGPTECVAAPAGGYFQREGERPGLGVFWLFPGPRPASPGPRLPAQWRGGSRGGGRLVEREGRRDPAWGSGPGPGPGGARRRCGPALLGRGRAAGLLIARLAPAAAAAPRRPLPARPSSGEHGWPGHSLPSDGLRPYWMALLRISGQSLASISLPVNWG